MLLFTRLFNTIDETTKTNAKVAALADYFSQASDEDAIWCVALLTGRRPRRTVKSGDLREWTIELSGLPPWLFVESYQTVGDLAETISLVIPTNKESVSYKLHEVIGDVLLMDYESEEHKKAVILNYWHTLDKNQCFVFNKLITGAFRFGVSQQLVIKALAKHYDLDDKVVAHRLSGNWKPEKTKLKDLLFSENVNDDFSKPYPFYLAYQLDTVPEELGDLNDWQIERKFDGIRGQIIVRNSEVFVWSRGEDLVTEKFPEFGRLPSLLPNGTVLDGEILPYKDNMLLPFHIMQTRIGRKILSKKFLDDAPLVMVCYDLLEYEGNDIRSLSMRERRSHLEKLISSLDQGEKPVLLLSETLECKDWTEVAEQRLQARDLQCEGLMLKHKDSVYETGRRRGNWWKWKTDALTTDGVLIYAQKGHGRRADLYTDYTFAVWDNGILVPFTKAYSGLTDKELVEVDKWIKAHTKEKFGPVRSVTPQLVFEIAFEGINPSPRHKSGIALRFPRISRWRKDKPMEEANTKQDLLDLIALQK
ncbi:MAG: ATP-dependent DNA ligase [Bacteroidia bacterium]|nr:ATP-dependent DNA ligase [Bacteroidia bacterium]